jgi:hypothetical protein
MKTSFTGNGHNKPFCPILLENTTFVKGLVQVKGLSPTGAEVSVKGYDALQEHFVGCCAASGAPLGFFVISDKEPKRRLEPRVLKIPHASGVQRITVNLCRAKCRTASFRWWKIALTSV